VTVDQLLRQAEQRHPIHAQLAPGQDQTRGEPQDIPAPRPLDGLVEVVQVEDALHARQPFIQPRCRAKGPEILQVRVAYDPTTGGRAPCRIAIGGEDLVKELRVAAQERERRAAHSRERVR
jgi:hypothetical protein